jgi:hypothetical protein
MGAASCVHYRQAYVAYARGRIRSTGALARERRETVPAMALASAQPPRRPSGGVTVRRDRYPGISGGGLVSVSKGSLCSAR